jgi:2-methylcitrate dehydratase PrpD
MTIATELGQRIRAISYADLPPEAIHWAKVGILDTVGVTLAGAAEPCAQAALRVSPEAGSALVFGSRRRLSVTNAAFVNGTASHALDYDDCSNTLGGHPSAPILPCLFALADGMDVSGAAFIAAYVAGFETETRLARAVNFHHYDKGWHPTATLGAFGAAAAASVLLDLTAGETATALAIAASFASGIKANFGTMTKPLHVGHCARNGLLAAQLAQAGMTASLDAFEHRQGFFEVFNGAGNYNPDAVLRDWAAPLDIITPGIAIKQYPCCGSTHPAIDAMLDLVRDHGLTADNVAHVLSWTHPRRLAHTNRPTVRSALDAKFSVQYCLARAVLDGRVVISQFEDGAYLDPRVAPLMARIEAAAHPAMSLASSAPHFGAEVRITTVDGRQFIRTVDIARGRTSANPLPQALLEAKYRDCAARALSADAVARSLALLTAFETLKRVAALSDILAGGCRAEGMAASPTILAKAS